MMTNEQLVTSEAAPASQSKATTKATRAPKKPHVAPAKRKSAKKTPPAQKRAKNTQGAKPAKVRDGSKSAKVLDLLHRPKGATLNELMRATGWQTHSVRGFLSGAIGKKMALALTSKKEEAEERTYLLKG